MDDPTNDGTAIRVAVNRRIDILEQERAASPPRISENQYCVGRLAQDVFEKVEGRSGGSNFCPGDRVDQTIAHELKILGSLDDARLVAGYMKRIERALGVPGARRLRALLCGHSFAQIAQERGRPGTRGATSVADQFRWALADLVEEFAARGATTPQPQSADDAAWALRLRAQRAAPSRDETDARGVLVHAGKGYRWGVRRA